jgi:hypothetical protein
LLRQRLFAGFFHSEVFTADEQVRVEAKLANDSEVHAFYRDDKTLVVTTRLKVVAAVFDVSFDSRPGARRSGQDRIFAISIALATASDSLAVLRLMRYSCPLCE